MLHLSMETNYYNYTDKEIISKWGEKIKSLRIEADISQTDLAKKTGLSRSSISEIENGRNFSLTSLIAIARYLEFIDEFDFFLKPKEYELSPMEIYEKEKSKKKKAGYKS